MPAGDVRMHTACLPMHVGAASRDNSRRPDYTFKSIVQRFISDAFHMSKRTSYSSVNKLAVDALIKNYRPLSGYTLI